MSQSKKEEERIKREEIYAESQRLLRGIDDLFGYSLFLVLVSWYSPKFTAHAFVNGRGWAICDDSIWLRWFTESKGVAFVAPAPVNKPVSSVLEKIRQRRLQLGCRYFPVLHSRVSILVTNITARLFPSCSGIDSVGGFAELQTQVFKMLRSHSHFGIVVQWHWDSFIPGV